MTFARAFRSDPLRHDGVRPFNIWGMRVFYLLMLLFVAPTAWRVLLSHEGPWLPLSAVAWAVWATYPVLALFGLFKPLRWLPILFFALGYRGVDPRTAVRGVSRGDDGAASEGSKRSATRRTTSARCFSVR